MTLHIALDGIDGTGKSTQVDRLISFFRKKHYKVRKAVQPVNEDVINILSNYKLLPHEIALLMAFDRSFTYYGEKWDKYDLVIWDRSILSSYVYNTDHNTPDFFIKQINRYFPEMDLYIIITHDTILENPDYQNDKKELITKYAKISETYHNTVTTPYIPDEPEEMTTNITRIIFDNLPRCEWCGRLFTPSQKHKKYCKKKCSSEANKEQCRENNRIYYHRYKDVMSERQKGGLGSKGANLHGKADANPMRELEKVRNAKRALGLKPIQ